MADTQDRGAALERQARQLETLDRLAQRFGASLNGALTTSADAGRKLSDIMEEIGASLSATIATKLATQTSTWLTGEIQSATRSMSKDLINASFGGLMPFAKGGVIGAGAVQPFADGGVVSAPTYFPMRGGLGLMGERGQEAIMPLARGPDGRLGVQGAGGGTQVTVNIQASDAASFRRSEAQVSAALARAVARGRRAL